MNYKIFCILRTYNNFSNFLSIELIAKSQKQGYFLSNFIQLRLFSQSYYEDQTSYGLLVRILHKLLSVILRIAEVVRFLPKRMLFLMEHLSEGFHWGYARLRSPLATSRLLSGIFYWWLELSLLLIDCLGISEWYEACCEFFKFNTRPLKDWEKELAQSIFGNTIVYSRIRLDDRACLGPLQYHVCYVSFYTINSWGPMNNSIFIHELVHVWQYQNFGITYIPRALRAGKSIQGYNSGGLERLKEVMGRGGHLLDFNYEQQADIISDYYRIKSGYRPSWGEASINDLAVYKYFVEFLQKR